MGDPCLWQRSQEVVQFDTSELHELVRDMEETMHHFEGVGLAAPQIGVSLRVVLFGFDANSRYPEEDSVPYTLLINPVLSPISDEIEEDWEGCLSIPGLRGKVPRYQKLRYEGFDIYGNPIDRTVEGFHARVVQHECDHLDGVLYPMRMKDLRFLGFTDALEQGRDD